MPSDALKRNEQFRRDQIDEMISRLTHTLSRERAALWWPNGAAGIALRDLDAVTLLLERSLTAEAGLPSFTQTDVPAQGGSDAK